MTLNSVHRHPHCTTWLVSNLPPLASQGDALLSQNKQLFSKPCLFQCPPRRIYRSGLEKDLEICHVGSGQQTLIVTLVENCLWFTLCTPCPYFHVCSLTKIWTEEMLHFWRQRGVFSLWVFLGVFDGDGLGLQVGKCSLRPKFPTGPWLLEATEGRLKR